jgi:hypothetical protein
MNTLKKEFVPYEEALSLKELGFDEPCFGSYDMETLKLWIGYLNDGEQFNREYYYPAPTFSQAFRWIREKYKINSHVGFKDDEDKEFAFYYYQINWTKGFGFQSHEEAELACLRKLIEIVKEKQILTIEVIIPSEPFYQKFEHEFKVLPSISLKERILGVLENQSIERNEFDYKIIEERDWDGLTENLISCFKQFG